MGRRGRRGKPVFVWLVLLAAAGIVPLHRFVVSQGYASMEEFFEDAVLAAILAGIAALPIIIVLFLARSKRRKNRRRYNERRPENKD